MALAITASFSGQAFVLVSGIAAARVLGAEGRGELALLLLSPPIVAQVVSLGLPLAATYYVAREGSPGPVHEVLRRAVLVQVIVATLAQGVIALAVAARLGSHPYLPGLATAPAAGAIVVVQYVTAVLQGEARYARFNVMRQLPAVLYTLGCIAIFAMPVGLRGVSAFVLVWSIAYTGAAVAAAASRPKRARRRSGEGSLRTMTGFGMKGFLGSISAIEMFRLDQAMVAGFLSTQALGVYVVASAFSNLPRFIGQAIGTVAYPRVARGARSTSRATTRRFAVVASVASVSVAVALTAAMPLLLPALFGSQFGGAVAPASLIVFAAAVTSVRRTIGDAARGAGHPMLGTWSEAGSWVVLVPGLIIAGHLHSLAAVAWTLLGGAVLILAATAVSAEWLLRASVTDD